ncbi:uncharacterized protein EI90DRAFT_3032755 [Cantharellus anzutake]|uniref:uncharacterized protein n=1 Tax=Cantharellus anzutake TaxID=1750568 RepID=UPI0019060D98|nr:uncharacterized protein EI90DRAFT_3032755 [Cantharellus anzutake]KAF8342278.1 hypothetical protein EI90DRAFT_3032755 [Cantharellus anzutake]
MKLSMSEDGWCHFFSVLMSFPTATSVDWSDTEQSFKTSQMTMYTGLCKPAAIPASLHSSIWIISWPWDVCHVDAGSKLHLSSENSLQLYINLVLFSLQKLWRQSMKGAGGTIILF